MPSEAKPYSIKIILQILQSGNAVFLYFPLGPACPAYPAYRQAGRRQAGGRQGFRGKSQEKGF